MKIKNFILALVLATIGLASTNLIAHSDPFYHIHEQPHVFLGCEREIVEDFTRTKGHVWVNVCKTEKVSPLDYAHVSDGLRQQYPGLRPRIHTVEPGEIYDAWGVYKNDLKPLAKNRKVTTA